MPTLPRCTSSEGRWEIMCAFLAIMDGRVPYEELIIRIGQ
jgi:hypothetical protein